MITQIQNIIRKKYFHKILIFLIIFIFLFVLAIIILKYNVEGETNMPFKLTKISIISSSEGIDVEGTDARWTFNVYQSNDIYLYIDKNADYQETKAIETVTVDNIRVDGKRKDSIKIYKPDAKDENKLFKNQEENISDSIIYEGSMESILKQLRISNQGGLVAFRCSNDNIATYISNDEEINHKELLKKAQVKLEDLNLKLIFDLSIKIKEGNTYKAEVTLDLPVEGIIEQGTASKEITEFNNIIFKRVNN